jgi:tetratricopeptide (TPR) repeat protein
LPALPLEAEADGRSGSGGRQAMTHSHNGRNALAAAVLLLGGSAVTIGMAGPSAVDMSAEVGVARATVDSKLRLMKIVLSESPAARRIPQSGNEQAKKNLEDARALYAKAEADAAAERLGPALKQLDEALRLIVAASHMVPDPGQAAAQERARYAELRDAIHAFLNLHRNLPARGTDGKAPGAVAVPEVSRIDALVDKAEAQAAAGNFQEANASLGNAYKIAASTLSKMMAAETITYDLKFDTPAEEFRYELARNVSYEGLVPIALSQSNAARDVAALAEGYVRHSRELRSTAQQQATAGDYGAALKTIQEATAQLQRSLHTAGIFVPQTLDANTR